jgi:hypothetical protein
MARADQNNLGRSAMQSRRQQRQEQPKVGGASGSEAANSPKAAATKARKRLGKTEKHTREDVPLSE